MTGNEENKSRQSQYAHNMIGKGKTGKPPHLWCKSSSPCALLSVGYDSSDFQQTYVIQLAMTYIVKNRFFKS